MNIWHGQKGLDVYEEIHVNEINRMIHAAFLPGVFYSIFRGVPCLLDVSDKRPIMLSIMAVYCGYYSITIDVLTGLSAGLVISPFALLAFGHHYRLENHVVQSVKILIASLVIQEVFGHTFFEEVNSRMEVDYIVNAIMFSPLFYLNYTPITLYVLQIYLCLYLL